MGLLLEPSLILEYLEQLRVLFQKTISVNLVSPAAFDEFLVFLGGHDDIIAATILIDKIFGRGSHLQNSTVNIFMEECADGVIALGVLMFHLGNLFSIFVFKSYQGAR